MQKRLTILFTLLTTILFGQANLVLTSDSFQPTSLARGEMINIQATVSNIGNVTAAPNLMFIYFTPDLTIVDDEIISRVSIKELAPNESQEISFTYPVPHPITAGSHYVGFEIDRFNVVPETDEQNIYCSSDGTECITFNIENAFVSSLKTNYPIIFIHGLNSNSNTWNTFTDQGDLFYGWNYGGRLDYCLNTDGDQETSNIPTLYDSYVNTSNLVNGDYFYVNFDVSQTGELFVSADAIPFNNDYSNQSAIYKQGKAVKDAIEKVLSISGSDKVILVGHSMGGLASREYLQNPENWQTDGEHHVAKLFTIGTPHGGNNLSASLISLLFSVDEDSEAVRDLRTLSSDFYGHFLSGGIENNIIDFNNNDVNCNNFVGDTIIGLNQKYHPNDLSYSCIVGSGNNFPSYNGDGIVDANSADFTNYLFAQPPLANPYADRFEVTSSHTSLHEDNHATLIQGLDEPTFYNLAYPIPLNSFKFGHSTIQAANNPAPPPNNTIDWDDYKIEVPENGLLEVDVSNIPVNSFALYLLDNNYNILVEVQSLGESNIGFSYAATPGTYYIELGSVPTANSVRYPYAYSVQFTPEQQVAANFTSNIQEGCTPQTINFSNSSTGNPTSFNWTFQGGTPATSTAENPTVTYSQPGIYPVSLIATNSNGSNTFSQSNFITVNQAPQSDFDFITQQNNTVVFTNQTQFVNAEPDYSWDFGDGQTSTENSPSHTYTSGGTYTVTLTATNDCGNSTTIQTVDITVLSADFTSNTQTGCIPATISFSDMSAGNPTSYSWTFQGGNPATSTSANPVVTYNTPGVYTVSLVVNSSTENSNITKTDFLIIDAVPTAAFSASTPQNNTITFSNETQYSNTAPSYSWDFGDSETSNLESPSHTYAVDGSYSVQLTATNVCGNSNSTKTVDIISVSTDEITDLSEITIFPNPNQGQFTLRISGDYFGKYETVLLNNLGQILSKGMIHKSGDVVESQFNLSSLPSGTYWVSLASERGRQVKKVLKF